VTDVMQEDFEDIEACARQGRRPREDGPYRVLIGDVRLNYQAFVVADPGPTGRQLLDAANLRPVEEYEVFGLFADGLLAQVGLDEIVDLRSRGVEKFIAFRSDRAFRFLLDGREYEWGEAAIEEAVLREIAHVPDDQVIELEREGGPAQIIDDGAEIRLDGQGVEHLRTKPRPDVTVKVNTKPVELPRGWNTGAQIKAAAIAAGVQIKPDFILHLEGHDGVDQVIGDHDRIFIRGGECFDALDNHEDS
jgi:hypothetical protein